MREVRQYPERFVATIVAIAISVAFMAAVSVFVTTQSMSLGRSLSATTSRADVVARVLATQRGVTTDQVRQSINQAPGVKLVAQVQQVQSTLTAGGSTRSAQLTTLPEDELRWSALVRGSWPGSAEQITLPAQLAERLGVDVGSAIDTGLRTAKVSGITDDPPNALFTMAYVTPDGLVAEAASATGRPTGTWLVRTAPGQDPAATVAAIRGSLDPLALPGTSKPSITVGTAEQTQDEAVEEVTGDFDVMKYLLMVFSAIAAVVGAIIITNTFTILLTQRRRQIGLMRAVGATGRQVRRRLLGEAVVLGALGSAIGLALGVGLGWLAAHWSGAAHWGLSVPVRDLAIEFTAGVLVTVVAAMAPVRRATKVPPLAALQPVASGEVGRRASLVRSLLCGVLGFLGASLCIISLRAPADGAAWAGPLGLAVAGALLASIALLAGAPLYIPSLLRLLGWLSSPLGTMPRMAATNTARNPRRAASTATALMLACGLVVTLQVGAETARRTVLDHIVQTHPVDVVVADPDAEGAFSEDTTAALTALPGVRQQATLQGGTVTGTAADRPVRLLLEAQPEALALAGITRQLADDQILVDAPDGTAVTLTGNGQTRTLGARQSAALAEGQAMTSPATTRALVATPAPRVHWAQLADRSDYATTMSRLDQLTAGQPGLEVSGSAPQSHLVTTVLDRVLMVVQGLLGAAILISLIGVANTLGLSVVERTRESALLRALGTRRRSLRMMLLHEALMLATTGLLVGLATGCFLGWFGVRAVLRQAGSLTPVHFGIDWVNTAGLLAVVTVAAVLGSLLPGRRAANTAPTQAMAQD